NSQHNDAEVHLPIHAPPQPARLKYLIRLEGEKEEGSVVSHRSDVVRILAREAHRVITRYQRGEWILSHFERQIQRRQSVVGLDVLSYNLLLQGGERRLFRQHDYRNPVFVEIALGSHNEMPGWICHTQLMKCFGRYRYHAQGLARLAEFPPGDG